MPTTPRWTLPREHGSWGILLFPLVSAAVLAKTWTWWLAPAMGAALAAFLLREPLTVLLRQTRVWRHERPETAAARRSAGVFGAALVLCGAPLAAVVPLAWLAGLAAVGAVLMGASLYAALHGLQRSTWLQVVGAFGLTSACALPWLAAGRTPDRTLGLLALVHAVHATGGVLTVHARLEAMAALRGKTTGSGERAAAWAWQAVQAAAALAVGPMLGAALAVALAFHVADLLSLRRPGFERVPLRRVGFRELFLSAGVSAWALAALW